MKMVDAQRQEALGPAEHIIQALLGYTGHLYHGRPGVVVTDTSATVGVRWAPVTHKEEDGRKVVYRLDEVGVGKKKKTNKVPIGTLWADNTIRDDGRRKVGEYRPAGLFPEVAVWMYRQVADVWAMDNEFAAKWASFAFAEEHRDRKVVLAAFMLVQSRKGDPVRENGQIVRDDDGKVFSDDDHRDIGEAMMLIRRKDKRDLNPKLLVRIYDLLNLPEIAQINRDLGFGRSARRPFLGRWGKAVERWLRHRDENPPALKAAVKAGFRRKIMEMCRRVGFKPQSPQFFEILRWKQVQAKDGRRGVAIGAEVAKAESWEGLSETEICERIVKTRPNYKRIVGMVPTDPGITRAIVAAAIEAGSLSDKDLVICSSTLEELGLLQVQDVRERWEAAVKAAEDQRAANIAKRVKGKEVREALEEGADKAAQEAVKEEVKDIFIYFLVDISSSMDGAIEEAKRYIEKLLQSLPLDRVHASVFNTSGRMIKIQHASSAGVRQAFKGISAGGGTDYGAGIRAFSKEDPPPADADVLMIFVGDEESREFSQTVRASGLNPVAFGLVKVVSPTWHGGGGSCVTDTAANLGIPCFKVDNNTFDDVYAVPRTIRALMAATPVGQRIGGAPVRRVTLVERILETELLAKPAWAFPIEIVHRKVPVAEA
jgi:hypothetical protein